MSNNENIKISYWKSNPLIVNEMKNNNNNLKEFVQILSNEELLQKVENDINLHKYKLNYTVNEFGLNAYKLCEFINENYIEKLDSKFKFVYTPDLIKYYILNSIVICFYSMETNKYKSKMIGLIIGKKTKLYINLIEKNSIEVNFLSLNIKARNKNLTPLMISILIKETILNYSIGIAHFTIQFPIKSPHYGLKYYYHRLINIKKLFDTEFIEDDINNINYYKKIYNNFQKLLPEQQIIYLNKNKFLITDELINFIYKNVNIYSKFKYKIYEYRTLEEIKKMFNIDSFHHFIFINNNNKIINYMCLNELKIANTRNNLLYSNAYIYIGFYLDPIYILIEKISEYVYLNKIFDVITWSDLFDNNLNICKCIKGTGFLKYYLFNFKTCLILNKLNGLVTL